MADRSVNHLHRDHREAQRILVQLESFLDAVALDLEWTGERREKFDRMASSFSQCLSDLFRKEGEILYPALEGLFTSDLGPLQVLRDEHQSAYHNFRQLSEISASLQAGKNPPETLKKFDRSGRKTIEILRDHMYKEERVLFPMAARSLTPERDAEMAQKMENLHPVKDSRLPVKSSS